MTEMDDAYAAWRKVVASLDEAGRRMHEATSDQSAEVRADGFRALARALGNQLGRLEWDDASPEMTAFNLWRQKFLMDNPDCRYWVTDISTNGRYRIEGCARGATFVSINVYAGRGLEAQTVARATSDDLQLDGDGRYSLVVGGAADGEAGRWLEAPKGANMVWVRHFYDDRAAQAWGACEISRIDPIAPPPMIDPTQFSKRLSTVAALMTNAGKAISRGVGGHGGDRWNDIREWSEMQGGAVYTEPGIHYQRGAWRLRREQALLIEGRMSPARHMSALLYSSFFNTLDYRNRQVSLTGPHIVTDDDGRFRLVISAEHPGSPNWLDNEGRETGLFVLRWLQPSHAPELPTTRVVSLQELGS